MATPAPEGVVARPAVQPGGHQDGARDLGAVVAVAEDDHDLLHARGREVAERFAGEEVGVDPVPAGADGVDRHVVVDVRAHDVEHAVTHAAPTTRTRVVRDPTPVSSSETTRVISYMPPSAYR